VVDKISRIADWQFLPKDESITLNKSQLYILIEGEGTLGDKPCQLGDEFGWSAFRDSISDEIGSSTFRENSSIEFLANSDCSFIKFDADAYRKLLKSTPQMNYQIRKQIAAQSPELADWILSKVEIY
jgi:hypothetical protein